MIEDFKFSELQATHQPKDVFKSADDAALAWALTYYTRSNYSDDMREYASAIYENKGGYSFTKPNIAEKNVKTK